MRGVDAFLRVRIFHLLQQLTGGFRVDFPSFDKLKPKGFRIETAVNIEPLAPRRGGNYRGVSRKYQP